MLNNTLKLVNSWAEQLSSPMFVDVQHEEDWTIIPVNVRTEDTLKIVESGIVIEEYTLIEKGEDDFDYSDEYRELEGDRREDKTY